MYPLTTKKNKLFLIISILSSALIAATLLFNSCSAQDTSEPEDITPSSDSTESLPPETINRTDDIDSSSIDDKRSTEPIDSASDTTADNSTDDTTVENTIDIEPVTTEPETETTAPETETAPLITAKTTEQKAPDPNKLSNADAAKNKIAFITFDDGPNKTNNERILEILEEYDVKATFFVVGQQVECYPDGLRATYEKGHAIGCHSYDHDYARVKTDITSEIEDWEKAVEKALGESVPTQLFRFPGGSPTKDENKLKDKVAELGYNGYDWNCLNNDCLIKKCPADMEPVEWMKQSFANTYKYGSSLKRSPLIILMHETYSETADMLAWAIEFLQEEGYTFGTLDQLSDSWYY